MLHGHQSSITSFGKAYYHVYFDFMLVDEEKDFGPHIRCRTYVEYLRRWSKEILNALLFGFPKILREGEDHLQDCYFSS